MVADLSALARLVGDFVMDIFSNTDTHGTQWKQDGTPFSAADTGAHEIIVDYMRRYPHIPIIGEEGEHGKRTHAENELWLHVDEIDGSTGFILGIPVFTIMITLMRGSRPIRTVVYDPVLRRAFTAEAGAGAFLNSTPIRVADSMMKNPMISICAWPDRGTHDMLIRGMVGGITTSLHERGYCFSNCCSIGYFDALVASGQLMASIFAGEHGHDTAAGDLLVTEAGGIAVDLRGKRILYDRPKVCGHIFASPVIYDEIFALVQRELQKDPSRLERIGYSL